MDPFCVSFGKACSKGFMQYLKWAMGSQNVRQENKPITYGHFYLRQHFPSMIFPYTLKINCLKWCSTLSEKIRHGGQHNWNKHTLRLFWRFLLLRKNIAVESCVFKTVRDRYKGCFAYCFVLRQLIFSVYRESHDRKYLYTYETVTPENQRCYICVHVMKVLVRYKHDSV